MTQAAFARLNPGIKINTPRTMEPVIDENNFASAGISITDHISAHLAYWDKGLVCRFANAAFLNWIGKTKEEIVNKITLKEFLGPELYEQTLPYITGVLAGRPQTFEREVKSPGGNTKHAIINYFPDIENGEVKGYFVHLADVSVLKAMEKKLVENSEVINDQNKRLLNFANIVSHNLKSYAGNLDTALDLFINATTEEEKTDMLLTLKKLSKRFGATVNNLNEIVKAQNLVAVKPGPIHLFDYILNAVEILGTQIKATNATICNRVNPDVILTANAAYVESILLNLLSNALKYKHPGRDPVVELDTFIKDNELILRIKDNGLGINLEVHGNNLFGMYKTFHGNADAQGVGLFITKFQVEAIGGRIEVESEENKGTTFSVHFKLA